MMRFLFWVFSHTWHSCSKSLLTNADNQIMRSLFWSSHVFNLVGAWGACKEWSSCSGKETTLVGAWFGLIWCTDTQEVRDGACGIGFWRGWLSRASYREYKQVDAIRNRFRALCNDLKFNHGSDSNCCAQNWFTLITHMRKNIHRKNHNDLQGLTTCLLPRVMQ